MDTPKSIADSRFYDPAIDGLRGLAILLVVLNHSTVCALQEPTRSFRFPVLAEIGKAGSGGVSLFFILSSLTLMVATRARFAHESSPKLSFYIRRSFRILPLWWVFIFVSIPIRRASGDVLFPHLFMYFGFIPHMNFTHVGWSLFVEETFYLFFPLLFTALLSPIGTFLFLAVTAVFSGRFFSFGLADILPSSLQVMARVPVYHYVTFALGLVCFQITKSNGERFHRYSRLVPKTVWDAIALAAFGASFFFRPHGNLHILSCFVFILACMVEGTQTRRLLSLNWLRTFGICCYSIYLFHGLFLFSIRYTSAFKALGGAPFSPDIQLIVAFLVAALVSYAFGKISFERFERPCVRLGKDVIRRLGLGRA